MRLFLAVNPSEHVRSAVARATAEARATAAHVRWVAEEHLHLTIKFLGERPRNECPRIASTVSAVVGAIPAFDATLVGAGAFPNFRAPRVVWIGMRNARPLETLARDVDVALASELGTPREERPFRAHLTLGRVKQPLSAAESVALERECGAIRGEWTLPIHAIDLMESELTRSGPRYSIVTSIPLGGS